MSAYEYHFFKNIFKVEIQQHNCSVHNNLKNIFFIHFKRKRVALVTSINPKSIKLQTK